MSFAVFRIKVRATIFCDGWLDELYLLGDVATLEAPVREYLEPTLVSQDGCAGGWLLPEVDPTPIKELHDLWFGEVCDLHF